MSTLFITRTMALPPPCGALQGIASRGASLQWLSQYPGEAEICFPPLTALTVDTKKAEGSVLVVELSLSTKGLHA